MEVILIKDHFGLGEDGDIVDVKGGFARNFLLPKKIAVMLNAQNRSILEGRKKHIEAKKIEKQKNSLSNKAKIEELALTFIMQASETGKLFGSITPQAVSEELEKHDIKVHRKFIEIPKNHIKVVGDYKIKVKLYGSDSANLKIIIVSKQELEKEEESKKASEEKEIREAEKQRELDQQKLDNSGASTENSGDNKESEDNNQEEN